MKKFEIIATMERIRDARREWSAKHREVNAQAARSMKRLIHEAAVQRMSVEDVSRHSGYPKSRIREMMRQMGLDPRWSKTLMAGAAAEALAENAELLGIDPVDMDLMSPLAYLPMGQQLRDELRSEATRGVTEIDDEPLSSGYWCSNCEMFEMDEVDDDRDDLRADSCQQCGCGNYAHTAVNVMPA